MPQPRSNPRREFIRHTVDVPIQVRAVDDGAAAETDRGRNLSHGGLAFESADPIEPGTQVEIGIAAVDPPFEATAEVVWCERQDGAEPYLVGVRFLDADDAFRARMVQQVCTIESYRKEIAAREGRSLTTDEAAAEWIKRYGGRFPDSS